MEDVLGSFAAVLKHIDNAGLAVEPLVFAAWKRCVDGALAEHVVALRLEKNRLIAAVANETWRRNVADLGPELAARINTAAGAPLVKYIEFQVNAEAIREHRLRLNQRNEQIDESFTAQLTPGLQAAAESIANEELRGQFLAAAASSLARRQATEQPGNSDSTQRSTADRVNYHP